MGSRRPRALFCQDVVERISRVQDSDDDYLLGLVWRVADDPDADLTSDEDDSDCSSNGHRFAEHKQSNRLPDGHAQVAWTARLNQDLERSKRLPFDVEKAEGLRLVDRTVATGNIVASVSDPLGQTAIVTGINRLLDIELSDGRKLSKVPTSALAAVNPYHEGQIVIQGECAGRIEEMKERIVVWLGNGEIASFVSPEAADVVMPVNPAEYLFNEAGHCLYYPGQPVWIVSGTARGHGTDSKKLRGMVLDVQVTHFHVDWVTSISGAERSMEMAENPVPRAACTCIGDDSHTCARWHLGARGIWLGDDAEPMTADSSKSEGEAAEQNQSDGAATQPVADKTPRLTSKAGKPNEDLSSESKSGGSTNEGGFQTLPTEGTGLEASAEKSSWASKLAHRVLGKSAPLGKRKIRRKVRRLNRSKQQTEPAKTALITRSYTYANLAWQDGRVERDVAAVQLVHRQHLDEHDFWPEDLVGLVPDEFQPACSHQEDKVGVVKSCSPKSRTATIAWMERGKDNLLVPLLPGCPTETLPVYKLEPHPDFNYLVGDLVSLLDSRGGVTDINSSLGTVIGAQNGELKLLLLNQEEIFVTPDRVADIISGLDDDGSGTASEDDNLDADSWTTVNSNEHEPEQSNLSEGSKGSGVNEEVSALSEEGSQLHKEEDAALLEDEDACNQLQRPLDLDPLLSPADEQEEEALRCVEQGSQPRDILKTDSGQASRTGSSALGSSPEAALGVTYGEFEAKELQKMVRREEGGQQAASGEGVWGAANRLIKSVIGGWPDADQPAQSTGKMEYREQLETASTAEMQRTEAEFPHFAVLEDVPLDHAFCMKSQAVGKKFQTAVLKEWKLLEASLPATIWVRSYESRMDLVRAAILGAADTPYAGHLFLFDMQLPPDYPSTPPHVHYRAWGLRINPNLYENGKVCLSLLGTWAGHKSEMWTPDSTLLQVLVSIQGLILVAKPYFNEAGYDKQSGSAEGEHNAVLYNEQAFLLTIRSALHLLAHPPNGFEDLIKANYRKRRQQLLETSKAIIGLRDCTASGLDGSECGILCGMKASTGFRLMLTELLPKFDAVLEKL